MTDLGDVSAQPIRPVLERGREEREHGEVDRLTGARGSVDRDKEAVADVGGRGGRVELQVHLRPLRGRPADLRGVLC